MRLGLTLGYSLPQNLDAELAIVEEADRAGYSVCWVAEAYGSDAVTSLSYLAARTESIDLGSAVLQIPARAPTMTAMTAATLDLLSGGRFRLGLGVSGPQVSEGWYGVPFARPVERTREYVSVVRQALRREPVRLAGEGKPLKLGLRPSRPELPIYLAALGPRNLALTGEIADGWLGVFVAPDYLGTTLEGLGRTPGDEFDVVATVPVVLGEDPVRCADLVRPYAALYLGGMGSRTQNFYNALATRMGYGDAAAEVQEHFLAGRHREAAAAVPYEFLDSTSLLGPIDRIAERMAGYAEAGVSTLSILPFATSDDERRQTVRTIADIGQHETGHETRGA